MLTDTRSKDLLSGVGARIHLVNHYYHSDKQVPWVQFYSRRAAIFQPVSNELSPSRCTTDSPRLHTEFLSYNKRIPYGRRHGFPRRAAELADPPTGVHGRINLLWDAVYRLIPFDRPHYGFIA